MNLTIAYITSRKEPKVEWFFESLANQIEGVIPDLIIVDSFGEERKLETCDKFLEAFRGYGKLLSPSFQTTVPKPSIWQGKYKITREEWWAKSNALNTAICLCKTDWIAFVDDRCVLGPEWLASVKAAMAGNYAVCGSYEKRANIKVENGVIIDEGELLGADTRAPGLYPFDSWYGGSGALPLEWCLAVNGFPERCDSLGSEDSMFGILLRNSGFPIFYNSSMRIIEDRTPSEIGGALKRADKNSHLGQRAKSWDIVRMFKHQTQSQNEFDIRNMRDRVLLNSESLQDMPPVGSHFDFYDGQPISEFE